MRPIIVTAAILCTLVVPASGQITPSVTFVGAYTVSYSGTETVVDVYKLTLNAPSNWVISAIDIIIGTDANKGGQDPFQAWRRLYDSDEGTWSDFKTPTQKGTKSFNTSTLWTGTNLYQTDTRFICIYDMNDPNNFGDPNKWIENWGPAPIFGPDENNDGSIYDPDNNYTSTKALLGKGDLWVTAGVPTGYRSQSMDIALIGVVVGDYVRFRGQAGIQPLAGGSSELFEIEDILIPEPATLALLAAGVGLLLRRRARAA